MLAFLAKQLADEDEPLPQSIEELLARIDQGWEELQTALKVDQRRRPQRWMRRRSRSSTTAKRLARFLRECSRAIGANI
jgi:hypothetical protein